MSRRRPSGLKIALAVLTALAAVVAAGVFTARQMSRHTDATVRCMVNMKNVGQALLWYAEDHAGRLPPAETWTTSLEPYSFTWGPGGLRCPDNPSPGTTTYALNSSLSSRKLVTIPDRAHTILLYETTHPADAPAGTGQDMPRPGLHRGYPRPDSTHRMSIVVTADGNVHTSLDEDFASVHW